VFDDNKKYVGNRGVNRDITASKQAEEKLQAKTEEIEAQNEEYQQINEELFNTIEKATESDRLKSAFLANMSHEIRTPMNGILGFAELLKGADLSGEQQQEYIHIIEKSGARMLNIINDIVSISKIESGIIDIYLSETDINNQLQFVYNSLKLDANNKKINLSFNCALTEKEAIIKTDSEKFYSILSNLVKNAIKYTDKGSVEFGYDKKSEIIEFFVKDTGIGISKDRQEAIFERFIQADIVDVKARQGAGLGLSIAKAYVELLGGKIWVESEKGKGSTFYFTLPYNAKAEEKIVVHNSVPLVKADNHFVPEVSKLKILIVEDDETSEMLITTDVEKFSKEIIKARDGFTSVEVCRNNPDIDLILMDIQMPVMNGYEATRQIRQFNKEVVIIAQTSFGLLGDKEKAIEAGCNDYIAKPIKKDELLSLIQKYFKK
jgi:signal transduction histidine kinase/CheY-like chemotaxis protein